MTTAIPTPQQAQAQADAAPQSIQLEAGIYVGKLKAMTIGKSINSGNTTATCEWIIPELAGSQFNAKTYTVLVKADGSALGPMLSRKLAKHYSLLSPEALATVTSVETLQEAFDNLPRSFTARLELTYEENKLPDAKNPLIMRWAIEGPNVPATATPTTPATPSPVAQVEGVDPDL